MICSVCDYGSEVFVSAQRAYTKSSKRSQPSTAGLATNAYRVACAAIRAPIRGSKLPAFGAVVAAAPATAVAVTPVLVRLLLRLLLLLSGPLSSPLPSTKPQASKQAYKQKLTPPYRTCQRQYLGARNYKVP